MGSAAIQSELWGRGARDWADLQEPFHTPLWEAMLRATNVGQATRFFDAGCGGGGASVLAYEKGAHVSGLDAAEPLVRIARERVPKGDFRTGDIEALPFSNAAFDVVLAANAIQYTADRVAALRELKRVCVKDGSLVAGLFSTADKVEFRVFFKAVRDSLPVPPPGDGPFGLSDPGKLEDLITQAGWTVLNSDEAYCPFVYRDFESLWQANVSAGPVQAALRSVSEAELKANARKAVESYQQDDGKIVMNNWFRYVTAVAD